MLFAPILVPRRRPDGFVMEQDPGTDEEPVPIKEEDEDVVYQAGTLTFSE